MPRRPSLPKDPSQRAKALLDSALNPMAKSEENPAEAAILGRKGGLKGGRARGGSPQPKNDAREIAQRGRKRARWGNAVKKAEATRVRTIEVLDVVNEFDADVLFYTMAPLMKMVSALLIGSKWRQDGQSPAKIAF